MYRTVKDIRFPVSVRNERAAMQRLLALVKDSLAGYPTSLEEDRAALKVQGRELGEWGYVECVLGSVNHEGLAVFEVDVVGAIDVEMLR